MLKELLAPVVDEAIAELLVTDLLTPEDCDRWEKELDEFRKFHFPRSDLEKQVLAQRTLLKSKGRALVEEWLRPLWFEEVKKAPHLVFKSATWLSLRGVLHERGYFLEVVWGTAFRTFASLQRNSKEIITNHRHGEFSDGEELIRILLVVDGLLQIRKPRWREFGKFSFGPLTLRSEQFGLRMSENTRNEQKRQAFDKAAADTDWDEY